MSHRSSYESTDPRSTSSNGKNSLTFENIVCSQLELKRRAASISRRRSTVCRWQPQFVPLGSVRTPPTLLSHRATIHSSPVTTTSPLSTPYASARNSSATPIDVAPNLFTEGQFLKATAVPSGSSRRSRTSSTSFSISGAAGRPSFSSIFYWDSSPRSGTSIKDESRASKWSIDFPKETPHYGSLLSRLIEEYTDSESLLEFAKKTTLELMKTKLATIFLGLVLILPIIMIGVGVSHLSDCPRQEHLPIYVFVAGIVCTTKLLQNIWHKYRLQQKNRNDEEPSSDRHDGHAFIDGLMTSFLVIWFFLGHYWLATIGYPPHFEQPLDAPDIWCHKSVVYCALASILVTYLTVLIFLSLVIGLVLVTRYTIIKRASPR